MTDVAAGSVKVLGPSAATPERVVDLAPGEGATAARLAACVQRLAVGCADDADADAGASMSVDELHLRLSLRPPPELPPLYARHVDMALRVQALLESSVMEPAAASADALSVAFMRARSIRGRV